jgi:hypothetical protein
MDKHFMQHLRTDLVWKTRGSKNRLPRVTNNGRAISIPKHRNHRDFNAFWSHAGDEPVPGSLTL